MKIGSLFSGAAGLDRAVEQVFGATTAWHCEVDPAASKVLAHRFPSVPNFGDISNVNWGHVEPVDILAGGFPCQDVSAAGRRAGIKDGTRSGLWAVYAHAISSLRPPIVVIENVRGLLHATAHRTVEPKDATVGDGSDGPVLRAAGAVLGDLAELGYDARWATVAASSIGAPHRRERVFIVANSRSSAVGKPSRSSSSQEAWSSAGDRSRDHCRERPTGDRWGSEIELLPTPCARDFKDATASPGAVDRNTPSLGAIEHYLPTPAASDCTGGGTDPQRRRERGHHVQLIDEVLSDAARWGKYAPAIAQWESVTRPAPDPTEPNAKGNPRLNAAFPEWMMGWPAGWVTDVPGISRNDQLRIIGNGVVPQQAVAALEWLLAVAA